MDVKTIFESALNSKSIQEFINDRFQSKISTVISNEFLTGISEITMNDGTKICPSDYLELSDINVFSGVKSEYDLSDLKYADRVLDVGANIGAFSVIAAKLGCDVTAIEPLYHRELEKTAKRNKINIKIIKCAIGENRNEILQYGKRKEEVVFRPLSDIIKEHGPFDFMKIDCEGGEWSILPDDLNGIRRIEGEFHNFPGMKPNRSLIDHIKRNYCTKIEVTIPGKLWLFHAYRK